MNTLRNKLNTDKLVLGTHISLNDSVITEIIGLVGYDYLWIDTEHTAMDLNILEKHLIAGRAACVPTIVRVPWNDPVLLKPVLEMGPAGVVIPMVNTREEAERAVKACKYPPNGIRGYGPRYAARFGAYTTEEYLSIAAEQTLCMIQIEHITAVNNIDEILKVDGVDVLIIGQCDLSASMGKLGQWYDDEVQSTIDYICDRAHFYEVMVGASLGYVSPEQSKRWRKRNINMISQVSDVDFIYQGALSLFNDMKKAYL